MGRGGGGGGRPVFHFAGSLRGKEKERNREFLGKHNDNYALFSVLPKIKIWEQWLPGITIGASGASQAAIKIEIKYRSAK